MLIDALVAAQTDHLREKVTHRVDCPADAPEKNVLLLTMLTGERHA